MKYTALAFCLINLMAASAQTIIAHDPVMAKQGDTYYLFSTGNGISIHSSKDKINWDDHGSVFKTPPKWAVEAVPGFSGHIWAPDISFRNQKYYLYYSVSAFGKNTSCIGVATNVTLDPKDKNYQWLDEGKVIESIPGRDLWNAIDPNLAVDELTKSAWLVFGSFWSGIKLAKMDSTLTAIAHPQEWYTVAKRSRAFTVDDAKPGDGAIEAPFIFKKNKYFYLFVSFDFCCRGAKSTYKIMVGRSEKIQGPYVDKKNKRMDQGGGSLVLQGNRTWAGLGHNSVYTFDDQDYIIFHAYDLADKGKPKLKIEQLQWDANGWPVASMK